LSIWGYRTTSFPPTFSSLQRFRPSYNFPLSFVYNSNRMFAFPIEVFRLRMSRLPPPLPPAFISVGLGILFPPSTYARAGCTWIPGEIRQTRFRFSPNFFPPTGRRNARPNVRSFKTPLLTLLIFLLFLRHPRFSPAREMTSLIP